MAIKMNWYTKPKFTITSVILNNAVQISEVLGALSVHLERNQDFIENAKLAIPANNNNDGMGECQLTVEQRLRQRIPDWHMDSFQDFQEAFRLLIDADKLDASVFNEPLGDYKKTLEPARMYKNLKKFFKSMQAWDKHALIRCGYFSWFMLKMQPFKDKEANNTISIFWQNMILSHWKPIFYHFPLIININSVQKIDSRELEKLIRSPDPTGFIEFNLNMLLSELSNVLEHVQQLKLQSLKEEGNVQVQVSDILQDNEQVDGDLVHVQDMNIDVIEDYDNSTIAKIDGQDGVQVNQIPSQHTEDNNFVNLQVKQLLSCLEKDKEYSKEEMMKLVNITRKPTFTAQYLKPALEAKLIVMTVPEKPTSRNQKYVLNL